MKIEINKVEGNTERKGVKQNKVYTIISESATAGFYTAEDEKKNQMTIWNVNGDWSKIGLSKTGRSRYTYTKDFTLIK